MQRNVERALKIGRLATAMVRNAVSWSTPFIRFIPTDRCNLDCVYCFQKSREPREMSLEEFTIYLAKARQLGVGLASFLGGEPMTWPWLAEAISRCSQACVLSDMTTNGTLIDESSLSELGRAGLDLLNVSVDVVDTNAVTRKNALFRSDKLELLLWAHREFQLKVRINSVMFKDNTHEIKQLVELAHRHQIPISVGFVVPEDRSGSQDPHSFTLQDRPLLEDMVSFLVDRKTRGYPIIDTREYFHNVFRYLQREDFWSCNYPRRYGWLNVTPSGRIRSCTKKMDELEVDFLNLDPRTVKVLRQSFAERVAECNLDCYSNCAYNGYYFFRNMPGAVLRHFALHPGLRARV